MSSFAEAAGQGVGSAFLFALTAGLLTALTPCVYPMIPITISIFGAKTGVSRGRAFVLATFYVAGIAFMFGTLGTVFALAGRTFGTFLANPWVVWPLALFFAAMAASMFGAFDLALPPALQARLSSIGGKGFGGAFLMGLVGGIIAAPCTGPPLAGILLYVATTRDAIFGFTLLATYAAGIGLPFWAIAGFSMSLPRGGRWMESVKSVFGIALLVAALYYLKNVVPPLGRLTGTSYTFLAGALGLTATSLLFGAVHLTFHDAPLRRLRKAAAVAVSVVAIFGVTNWLETPRGEVTLTWHHTEAEALAAARASGRPLLVDFGADWCKPCKRLETDVFTQRDVATRMQQFTLLKVDCTREDDAIEALRKKYESETFPSIRVVSPDGRILGRTDDEHITPEGFLEFLSRHST